MNYFDVFAGVGGFSLGIHNAYDNNLGRVTSPSNTEDGRDMPIPKSSDGNGRRTDACCIGFSEYDKSASDVLRYRFPNIKNYGDIKKIDWSEVPDFDLLVGGSPCQDLSIAGKRAGLGGERSGLFAEYVRALKEKKPDYFIWENVKGALSSNGGWDFARVQIEMAEAGYDLWWQILNAKDFGVPQNRERIFIIGFRDGGTGEIFFERGAGEKAVIANTIRTGGKGSLSKKHAWDLIQINQPKHSNDRVYSEEGISPTLNTMGGGNRQPFISRDTKIRRLTPVECERLMSWPDDWTRYGINEKGETVEMSDTQRYKMAGNGVVSKVVEHLIKEILIPSDDIM